MSGARVATPDATDVQDVKFLLRHSACGRPEPVLAIVASYYPPSLSSPRPDTSLRLLWRERCSMKTLRELADNVRAGRPLEIELGEFLDDFYLAPDAAKVEEPHHC